jgi:hypothetical protein
MTETTQETPLAGKKPHKKPAPVKYYALVEIPPASPEGLCGHHQIEAEKKTDLYAQLDALQNPKVLILVRGRLGALTQKVSWKI